MNIFHLVFFLTCVSSLEIQFTEQELVFNGTFEVMDAIFAAVSLDLTNAMKMAKLFRSPLYDYAIHFEDLGETEERINQLVELARDRELWATLFPVSKLVANPKLVRRILAENILYDECLVCAETGIGGLRLKMADEWVQKKLMVLATGQLSRMESLRWLWQYLRHTSEEMAYPLAEILVPKMTPEILALLLPKTNAEFLENYLSTDVLCRLMIVSVAKITCQAKLAPMQESIFQDRWQNFSMRTIRIQEELYSGDIFADFVRQYLSATTTVVDSQLFTKIFGLLANMSKERSDISYWTMLAQLLLHCDSVVGQEVCMERAAWYLEAVDFSIVPPLTIRGLMDHYVPKWDDSYFKKTLERIPTSHLPNGLLDPQMVLRRWMRHVPLRVLSHTYDRHMKTCEELVEFISNQPIIPLNVWVDGQWIGDVLIRRAKSVFQSRARNVEAILMAWPYLLLTGQKIAMDTLFKNADHDWSAFIRQTSVRANYNPEAILESFYIPGFFIPETLRVLIDSTFQP